jgi:hypothetical protein
LRVVTSPRDEAGSIPIIVLVMFVVTLLVSATAVVVDNGLRVSRRTGDSANALQLADAAVNHALKMAPTATGASYSITNQTLGSAGSYSFTATKDTNPNVDVWHVDATGADPSGVKRRVKADLMAEALFGNAFFIQAKLTVPAGASLDSFRSGANLQEMCTRRGVIGTNTAATMTFGNTGSGIGVRNCVETTYGTPWPHPVDGCISYADENPPLPPIGTGKCPPAPDTKLQTPKFAMPKIAPPKNPNGTDMPVDMDPPACDGSNPLRGGTRYHWNKVKLRPGCYVKVKDDLTGEFLGPAIVYTPGVLEIGSPTGTSGTINAPPLGQDLTRPLDPTICPTYLGSDLRGNPANYYCPGWSSNLRIYLTGTGETARAKFGNHAKFWGAIVAPNGTVEGLNTGSPQVEMWGAIIAAEAAPAAQFTVHYDERLGALKTGRYITRNWREEPVL